VEFRPFFIFLNNGRKILTNSEDIIKNIKNGKEIPVNENNVFSYFIINLLRDYKLPELDIELEIQFNQNLMKEEDKNFCIKNQSSICHIQFGINTQTGFFCKVNHKSIPFKRALITGYQKEDKSIIINYLKDNKMIEKTINLDKRKIIIKEDILFIELFENDNIENFFEIEEKNLKEIYESNDIIILQYDVIHHNRPLVKNFSFSSGKIISYQYNSILYEIPTIIGALGSPIILGNNNYYVIGVHIGRIARSNIMKKGQNLYSIINNK